MKTLVINKDNNEVDYTIEVIKDGDSIKYKLNTSYSDHWNDPHKGETQVEILDSQDDYTIKIKDFHDIILDASEISNLQILLNYFISKGDRTIAPEYLITNHDE